MPSKVTDEQIAAYVDGSLTGDDAAEVAEAILRDPEVRRYADSVRDANRVLREAFDGPMEEPVSDELREIIMGHETDESRGEVVDLGQARKARKPWFAMALAASVALVVGITSTAVVFQGEQNGQPKIATSGPAATDGPLHLALEEQPSGAVSPEGVQVILTFFDRDQRICREFEVMGQLPDALEFGIACRGEDQSWNVEIVVTGPATEIGPDGYRPASGPGADALEAILDSLGAQPALSPAEETELLGRGWR